MLYCLLNEIICSISTIPIHCIIKKYWLRFSTLRTQQSSRRKTEEDNKDFVFNANNYDNCKLEITAILIRNEILNYVKQKTKTKYTIREDVREWLLTI